MVVQKPRSAVVFNPSKVDDLEQVKSTVGAALDEAGWPEPDWYETEPDDPGCGQAEEAVEKGAELVFAHGGDGTVRSCATALAGSEVPLAILPGGTGNLLARNLGVPTALRSAVRAATHGRQVKLDVGRTEDTCFFVAAGVGFDADLLVDAPEDVKKQLGWFAYVLSGVKHIRDPRFKVRLDLDGDVATYRARSVMIANVSELRGGLSAAPEAKFDDGMLDVVIVSPRGPRDWPGVLYRTLRRRKHDRVKRFTACKVGLHVLGKPINRQLDGDPLDPGRTMEVTVDPGALTVYVPA